MSELNIKKLKVAELREELEKRGLDTKGTKPVLLKRLEEAIVDEGNTVADESTLTESGLDTSSSAAPEAEDSVPEQEVVEPESAAPEAEAAEEAVEAEEPEDVQQEEEEEAAPELEEEAEPEAVAEEAKQSPEPEPEQTEAEQQQEQEEQPEAEAEAEEPAEVTEEQPTEEQPTEEPEQIDEEESTEAPEAENEMETNDEKPAADEEPPKEGEEEIAAGAGDEEEPEDEQMALDEQAGEFQVMDSVGDDADAPEADQQHEADDDDRRGEKRRHDDRERERDRERRRYHRRSRSRSPERSRHRSSPTQGRDRNGGPHSERSRSPWESRGRRHRTPTPERRAVEPEESEEWVTATNVQLDRYNCDLNIRVNDDGVKCCPITVEGFAFMWSGVRSNYGITKGKISFEVKIVENLNVDHLPPEETSRHVVRVGFSTDDNSLQLGEEELSYGYGGTAKSSVNSKFEDYGETFGEGDVVTAYLDLDGEEAEISFSKNGEDQGKCFTVDKAALGEKALFPHILSKNCEFEVNFGQREEPQFPTKEGFTVINDIPEADRVRGTAPPAKKEDCEILMLCGLPAAGKTAWAAKHVEANKDKRYSVLGTNSIIDKMKVMGLPRKRNYAGRWDVLIDKSTKCLNRMLEIASKKKRNYVLDQTNVYPSAQRRKMRPFEGFQRKAIVIVPTDEEFKTRTEQREKEEGKDVPDSAVIEMKANFQLPEVGQTFDAVDFIELEREEAQKLVEKYNEEGRAALPPPEKRWREGGGGGSGYSPRYQGQGGRGGGRDYRGGYDRDRRYSGGYDRGYDNRRGGGRGSYDDRRRGGSYMGYSSSDRRRAEGSSSTSTSSYKGGDRDRRDHRDSRSSGYQSSWGNKGHQGGWGNQQGGSWGGQQGGWGGQQGSWNQGGWGGQQGYGGWGGQWAGYNQGGWGQQNQGGWGSQGYNYGGQGQQGYNYNQGQSGQSGWGSTSGSGTGSGSGSYSSSGNYSSSGYNQK